jgi:uncharacterized membrane protein YraQ (UPF0718 family)
MRQIIFKNFIEINLWARKKIKKKTVEKERKIEKRELHSAIWSSRKFFKFLGYLFLGCCHGGIFSRFSLKIYSFKA